jgi:hypothetical protein
VSAPIGRRRRSKEVDGILAAVAIASSLAIAGAIGAFLAHDIWPAPAGRVGPKGFAGPAGARGPTGTSANINSDLSAMLETTGYCVAVTTTTGPNGNPYVRSVNVLPPTETGRKLSCRTGSFIPLAPTDG